MGFVQVANSPLDDILSEKPCKSLGPFVGVLSVLDEMSNQDFKDANPLRHENHKEQNFSLFVRMTPLLPLPCPGVLLTSAYISSKTLLSTQHFWNIIVSLP